MKKIFAIYVLFAILSLSLNAQWKQTSLDSGQVNCFAIKGNNIYAGSNYGVYLSTNDGNSWVILAGCPNANALAIKGRDTIFAGTTGVYKSNYGGVYFSSNSGSNWIPVNNNLPTSYSGYYPNVYALAINGNNIFAGTSGDGVFMSSNNGQSWISANTGITSTQDGAFVIKGDTIFVGTSGSGCGLFMSTNNGQFWITDTIGLQVYSLAIKGNTIFVGTWEGAVYMSSNNEKNWIFKGYTNSQVNTFAVNGKNIFAGCGEWGWTSGAGVYMSSNNGSNWIAKGLSDTSIIALAINSSNIFAGTYGYGIWKRPLSQMTGIEEINNNASNITVYPNPANDNITIENSSLNNNKDEMISIYNIQGKLLMEQLLPQTKTEINISNLSLGLYFVKITDNKNVIVKKIIKE